MIKIVALILTLFPIKPQYVPPKIITDPIIQISFIHPLQTTLIPKTQFISELPLKPLKQSLVSAPASLEPAQMAGNCADWITAAGITEIDAANELIRRESGCNPHARNTSSGACGVAQELPCGKSGCSIGDGSCQVKWMSSYIQNRYGSWSNALDFHDRNNYY